MAFVLPKFSKGEVNRAGDILRSDRPLWSDGQGLDHIAYREQMWANTVLANWRGIHTYPINTFQATLRLKLRDIDSEAIVAQRLKRAPSIVLKLQRFEGMKLARMQDIGGLRAIAGTMGKVRRLEKAYRTTRFAHELISSKDYIREPKPDGYRGIHLIYRNKNNGAPAYNGLSIEMQFRTRLQHAWATAVETMGTFLGQALKSGQGDEFWRNFFGIAGAALAVVEKTQAVPGYENRSLDEIGHQLAEAESRLRVIEKLRGFAVATNQIHTQSGPGAYHLIVLDSTSKSVSITPYSLARLEDATADYSSYEQRTRNGEPIEAVLVSAGPVDNLRKAYPNYFLDTAAFIRQIERIIEPHLVGPRGTSRQRRRVRARR